MTAAQGCIVIVTHNGARHIKAALDSCAADAPDVLVVIVDNCSTDDTRGQVRSHPHVAQLLPQQRNLGYGAAANVGFRTAHARGARWVLLMNQDAVLTSGAVRELARVLDADPNAAGVQPLILRPDGLLNSAGNPVHWLGFSYAGGNGLQLDEARRNPALPWMHDQQLRSNPEVPALSGAAVMLRCAALRHCGGFEPSLFLYHEDFELSLRLRAAGWTLRVAGDARVVHDYAFHRNPDKWFYLERNRHWVLLAHLQARTLAIMALPLLAAEAAVWVRAVRDGWAAEKLRSYLWWLQPGAVRHLIQRRRHFATLRRRSDAELLATATGRMVTDNGETALLSAASEAAWKLLRRLLR